MPKKQKNLVDELTGLPAGSRVVALPTQIFEPQVNRGIAPPQFATEAGSVSPMDEIGREEFTEAHKSDESKKAKRKALEPAVRASMEKRLRKDELLKRAGNTGSGRLDRESRNKLMERLHDERRMVNNEPEDPTDPSQEIGNFRQLHSAPGIPAQPQITLTRAPDGTLMDSRDLAGVQQREARQARQPEPSFLDSVLDYLKD